MIHDSSTNHEKYEKPYRTNDDIEDKIHSEGTPRAGLCTYVIFAGTVPCASGVKTRVRVRMGGREKIVNMCDSEDIPPSNAVYPHISITATKNMSTSKHTI